MRGFKMVLRKLDFKLEYEYSRRNYGSGRNLAFNC